MCAGIVVELDIRARNVWRSQFSVWAERPPDCCRSQPQQQLLVPAQSSCVVLAHPGWCVACSPVCETCCLPVSKVEQSQNNLHFILYKTMNAVGNLKTQKPYQYYYVYSFLQFLRNRAFFARYHLKSLMK